MSNCRSLTFFLWVPLFPVFSASFSENTSAYKDGQNNALFLTPYIESGRVEEAQQLAKVEPMLKSDESFAGYLTVNKTCNSNMFFWLFKSQMGDWQKKPLIVWLQGGIAQTSLFGLLRNVGPFFVNKDQKLKPRKYSWNRKYNLVFIDNPVGAGYSFTDMKSGYPTNELEIAHDLYEFLIQLHKLFPSLKKNKLVIAGESYGGKYAVAIAHKIYKMNQLSHFKLNLERLILASAFVDPFRIVKYGSFLYGMGLLDKTQKQRFSRREEEFRADIKAGEFKDASKLIDQERDEIRNITGQKGVLGIAYNTKGLPSKTGSFWFINRTETKIALHVGDCKLNDGAEAISHLTGELVQSVTSWLEELLAAESFPIICLNGQLDILTAYSLGLEVFNSMEWPLAKEYSTAKRCQFKVKDQVAAYYKTVGTFTEVLVRNTGHIIPASKPKWAFELVDRFIANSDFFQCV